MKEEVDEAFTGSYVCYVMNAPCRGYYQLGRWFELFTASRHYETIGLADFSV